MHPVGSFISPETPIEVEDENMEDKSQRSQLFQNPQTTDAIDDAVESQRRNREDMQNYGVVGEAGVTVGSDQQLTQLLHHPNGATYLLHARDVAAGLTVTDILDLMKAEERAAAEKKENMLNRIEELGRYRSKNPSTKKEERRSSHVEFPFMKADGGIKTKTMKIQE